MRSLALTLILLAAAISAEAGWVIDQTSRGEGGTESGQQQVFVQGNRMKTVTLADGKPSTAVILDIDARTITQIDYRARHYFASTVDDLRKTLQGAQHAGMAQMEEALKSVPPEQRKLVEEMMRRQMGQAGGGGAAPCPEPRKVNVRKTDQRETIAGFPAVRYDVTPEGQPAAQVWVAAGITAWREMDREKLRQFAEEMSRFAACHGVRGPVGSGRDDPFRLASEGYTVRTVGPAGRVIEVTQAEQRPVPAAEFQPPADFARRTLADPGPPQQR